MLCVPLPKKRTALIRYLKSHGVYSVFHYLSLHKSDFVKNQKVGGRKSCHRQIKYTDCLVRFFRCFMLWSPMK